MPRGPRLDIAGALHHVMVRGIERRRIFLSDGDRKNLIERFVEMVAKTGIRIYAWSLMPNHFHMLVRTGPLPLSSVMRKVLTGYAVTFNKRRNRTGHLFQNRYKSILVEEEPYVLELVRYIHLNPVRAKLVGSMEELDGYQWAGHGALMGKRECPWQDTDYILGRFGEERRSAQRAYRSFVEGGIAQGSRPDLAGGGLIRSIGGWEKAREALRGREKWSHDERVLGSSDFVEQMLKESPQSQFARGHQVSDLGAAMRNLITDVALRMGLSTSEITSGSRRHGIVEARKAISYLAVRKIGLSLTKAASILCVSSQSVLRGVEEGHQVIRDKKWSFPDFDT